MTSEISAVCVFCLFEHGDFVVMVIVTASYFLVKNVDLEWEISRLAVSVNFSSGVTVPAVFHSEGWSTKVLLVFVVLDGIVRASSVKIVWVFAFVQLEAVLTCIVKCG